MRREVRSPGSEPWIVEIDWVARRINNPWSRSVAAVRHRRAQRRADGDTDGEGTRRDRRSDWLDCVDCPTTGTDLDGIVGVVLLIVAVVLVVVALVWLAPVIWAVLAVLVEFFILMIAALGVLVWRTLARRPWNVVVRHGDERWSTKVVGYRRARRQVRTVASQLEQGIDPDAQGLARTGP